MMSLQEAHPAIRRAAARLTRVTVDLGPGHPRLAGFAESVCGEGDTARLILSPIAAHALPPPERLRGPVTLRFADDEQPFALLARSICAEGDQAASLPLAGTRITALAPRATARGGLDGRQPLVLAVPGGLDEGDVHAFPIVDLGASVCSIETLQPLPVGRVLDPVEIFGDRRLLRRASVTVLETLPWWTADGSPRFRTRLAIDPSGSASGSGPRPGAHEPLSRPDRVRRVLELAAMVETDVWFHAPAWGRGRCRVVSVDDENVTLRLDEALLTVTAPARIRIGFELFATSYEMDMRLVRRRPRELTMAFPLVLRRRRQRHEPRVAVPEGMRVVVRFRNPATARIEERAVRDLSLGGLCFAARCDTDVLWSGLPLQDVALVWDGGRAELGEAEVRGVEELGAGELACHTAIRSPRAVETPLVDLMARIQHPRFEVHDGRRFDDMVDLYRRVGLFGPHMERNIEPALPEAAVNWERLHGGAARDLVRTLVQREDGEPVASVSAVRGWERSWVIQHMVADARRRWREPGVLHMAYLDYVLPRPDGHYMVVFVKDGNDRITSFLDGFFELTGTPEAVARKKIELWIAGPDARPGRGARGVKVRAVRQADEELVARASERLLGSLGAASLSMLPGELRLSDTTKRFRRAGIQRTRAARLLTRDGEPAAAVLHERAASGFNLCWLLNATWILPVHPGLDVDGAVMGKAADLALAERPSPAGERFVLVAEGTDTRALAERGFVLESPVWLHSYNRAGLHRWYHFIHERYGEVAALKREATDIAGYRRAEIA